MDPLTNLIPENFNTWTRQPCDCDAGEQQAQVFVAATGARKTILASAVLRDSGRIDTETLPEPLFLSLEETGIALIPLPSDSGSAGTAVAAGARCNRK